MADLQPITHLLTRATSTQIASCDVVVLLLCFAFTVRCFLSVCKAKKKKCSPWTKKLKRAEHEGERSQSCCWSVLLLLLGVLCACVVCACAVLLALAVCCCCVAVWRVCVRVCLSLSPLLVLAPCLCVGSQR